MAKHMRAGWLAAGAAASLWAGAAPGQSTRRIDFRGDVAAEAATAVEATGLEALKGLRTVIIPQFTVEFVERSDGLSSKEEKRQDYVRVDYRVQPSSDIGYQAITDALYARWVAGLRAQGLTVIGPTEAAAMAAAGKLAKSARPTPALIRRASGENRIFAAETATYLMPRTALGEAATEGEKTAGAVADTGAAVASKVGGKMGGMFGMARGLGKLAGGAKTFGGAWTYAEAENALAKGGNAGVMTVRLAVGLRDIDMAGRGFGLFRSAGSYDGKPRLVVLGDASEVTIATPKDNKRAEVLVPQDLVFAEDVLKGRLAIANSAGATAANVANKAIFATAAIGGGSAAINQVHHFSATPDGRAYTMAVERNLQAVEDIFLRRLAGAW